MVAFIGVRTMYRLDKPAFDETFQVPIKKRIDAPLVFGSALFGLGGIGGFCPGPAIASLSVGLTESFLFVAAMLVGTTIHDRIWSRRG